MQKLIELLRIHAQHAFLLGDELFLHHVHRDAHSRRPRPLAIARLQHVELAFLHRELEILHVAIMFFQIARDLAKLAVDLGHGLFKFGNGLRRADTGHHVLALRVHQELAVKSFFAGRRVAGEAHARGRGVAQVAEHHGLDIDRGAEIVRNLVHAAIRNGALSIPGTEDGVPGHGKLLPGFLWERFAGFFLDQLLIINDDGFQIFGRKIGIDLCADFFLARVEYLVEIVLFDFQHHVPEHLYEAAVAVLRESRITASPLDGLHGLIVQT